MKMDFQSVSSRVLLKELYPIGLYVLVLLAWGLTGIGIKSSYSNSMGHYPHGNLNLLQSPDSNATCGFEKPMHEGNRVCRSDPHSLEAMKWMRVGFPKNRSAKI